MKLSVSFCELFLKSLKMFSLSLSNCKLKKGRKKRLSHEQFKTHKYPVQYLQKGIICLKKKKKRKGNKSISKSKIYVCIRLKEHIYLFIYLFIEMNLLIHYVNSISPYVEAITCWQSMHRQRFISAEHYPIFDQCGDQWIINHVTIWPPRKVFLAAVISKQVVVLVQVSN